MKCAGRASGIASFQHSDSPSQHLAQTLHPLKSHFREKVETRGGMVGGGNEQDVESWTGCIEHVNRVETPRR